MKLVINSGIFLLLFCTLFVNANAATATTTTTTTSVSSSLSEYPTTQHKHHKHHKSHYHEYYSYSYTPDPFEPYYSQYSQDPDKYACVGMDDPASCGRMYYAPDNCNGCDTYYGYL
jgi:hypothetical protein